MHVELKVGQVWKTRGGEIVVVGANDGQGSGYFPFKANGRSLTYTYSGHYVFSGDPSCFDLIELVQDENGWRPWKATKDTACPVVPITKVRVRGKSGSESECMAGNVYWCTNEMYPLFDPVVAYKIIEEAAAAKEQTVAIVGDSTPRRHSHYFKDVSQINEIDVYRVCDLFGVDDPSGATQHAVKKLLCAGQRGAKDRAKDYQEAIDTLTRRVEMWAEGSNE